MLLQMKKWILLILPLIILGVFTYILIPSKESFRLYEKINFTQTGTARLIQKKQFWNTWWQGKAFNPDTFLNSGVTYRIDKILFNKIEFTILPGVNTDSIKSSLEFSEGNNDSTDVYWNSFYQYSLQPIKRINQYFTNNKLKSNAKKFLEKLKCILEDQQKIYGFKIATEKVIDGSLISTKKLFNHYPTTDDIYTLTALLKTYIKNKEAFAINPPMLNVYTEDSLNYSAMVAIPTNKTLPSTDNISLKKMVLGKILMAEVKGGPLNIKEGEKQLRNYFEDYRKASPAIPFQSLVTDRSVEPDTSKWITRLYYPIYN